MSTDRQFFLGPDPQENENADVVKVLKEVTSAFKTYREETDKRLKKFEDLGGAITPENVAKVDKLGAELLALQGELKELNRTIAASNMPSTQTGEKKEAMQLFNRFLRSPTRENGVELNKHARARMEVTQADDPSGGYFVPPTMADDILQLIDDMGGLAAVSTTVPVGSSGYKRAVREKKVKARWASERGSRGDTPEGRWGMIEIPVDELTAEPDVPASMLEDSVVDLSAILVNESGEQFGVSEGEGFLHGNGQLEPRGIMNEVKVLDANWEWGKIGYHKSGAAAGFPAASASGSPAKGILTMLASMRKGYTMGGAHLLMNRLTEGVVMNLTDADGKLQWQPAMQLGVPSMFGGFPIQEDDFMDDVEAGKFPIMYTTKGAYYVVRRRGMTVLRDPFTKHPLVIFKVTQRAGGGVMNYEAVKFLKTEA